MVAPHVQGQLTRSLVRVPNSGSEISAAAIIYDLSRVSSVAALVPVSRDFPHGILLQGTAVPPPSSPPLKPVKTSMKSSSGVDTLKGAQEGTISADQHLRRAAPQTVTKNSPFQITPGVGSVSVSKSSVSSNNAGVLRTGFQNELLVSSPENTTTTPASGSGTGAPASAGNMARSRKRPLRFQMQSTASSTEDVIPTKTRRTSGSSTVTNQMPRRPTPSRKAGGVRALPSSHQDQQLLLEVDHLRSENLVLKRCLSRFYELFRNKESLAFIVRRLGVEVH